jgi:tetratricopeptide (TPR) repeat protein
MAQQGKTFAECTRSPSESDVAAAKGAFEAGQVSFHEADYDRAILYWEDAFRRDCTALLLLVNLARAYELSGQRAHAVASLETYLERRPNAAERDQILRRIEGLQRQLDRERDEAAAAAPPEPEEGPPAPATVVDEGTGTTDSYWPLVVAGSGVAVGIAGAVLWGANQSTINRSIDRCTEISRGEYECPDQVAEDARAAQRRRNAGIGVTLGGAALALGGAVTYFVLNSQSRQSAGLTPSVGPGFAGLTYAGAF